MEVEKMQKPFEFSILAIPNDPYPLQDSTLWEIKDLEYMSDKLIRLIRNLKHEIQVFIRNGYFINETDANFSNKTLQKVAHRLINQENLVNALFKTNGYIGEVGLEFAKLNLIKMEQISGELPKNVQIGKQHAGILTAISKGYWVEFGIRQYHVNDMLMLVFSRIRFSRKRSGYYSGKQGLVTALAEANDIKDKLGRMPIFNDIRAEFGGIASAITRGVWEDFGVTKNDFNSFMRLAFNRTNLRDRGYYVGEEGLKRAIIEVRKFSKEMGKIPTKRDLLRNGYGGIIGGIKNWWEDFGIKKYSYNDFLMKVFGRVNQRQKPSGYYIGHEGLSRAIEEVHNLETEMERMPNSTEIKKQYAGIDHAICQGYWTSFGIRKGSRNDFIRKIFGKVNRKARGYYIGRTGLLNAFSDVEKLIEGISRFPTASDLQNYLPGVYTAIYKRYWRKYGIRKRSLQDFRSKFENTMKNS